MSSTAVILICLGFGVSVVRSEIRCLDCLKVRHASECAKTITCPPDHQMCASIASKTADGIFYRYQCSDKNICKAPFSILALVVGKRKREPGPGPGAHGGHPGEQGMMTDPHQIAATPDVHPNAGVEQELCMACCNDADNCNKDLCLIPNVQTKPPTVASASPSPTVVKTSSPPPTYTNVTQTLTTSIGPQTTTDPGDPNCRDYEEDGIKCSLLNMAQICSEKSMLGYVMMRKKCPMTCRLCKPVQNATTSYVTPPPGNVCEDFEQDGIKCVYLDFFDVCSDQTSLAVIVAHEKCRKHCGICQSNTTATTAPLCPIVMTQTGSTIMKTNPTKQPSASSTTTPATKPIATKYPVTTTTRTAKTTTAPCVDVEDKDFSCAEWDSHGYCLPFPGVGYETSQKRCRKYCGYC